MYIQPPICVDDFGIAVYRCRYTKHLVWAQFAKLIGATMPGVKCRYVMEDSLESAELHRQQSIDFHESETNCNTCKHLDRTPTNKTKSHGWLSGNCKKLIVLVRFHPDDPMHMPCYKSRWSLI